MIVKTSAPAASCLRERSPVSVRAGVHLVQLARTAEVDMMYRTQTFREELCHSLMTSLARDPERCSTGIVSVIDRCMVHQQNVHCFYVPTRCRNPQR